MDEIVVRRWRRLGVRRWGDLDGSPVFLLHGTPGSRLGTRPADGALEDLGVCLITYDRPGYGMSDPQPGRSVADAASDILAIANAFGYRRFAVLGRSGGGPHALACAALLPDRVTRVASLAGIAPYEAAGLDWLAGMTESNRREYVAAIGSRAQLAELVYPRVIAMRANPEHLLTMLASEAPAADRARLADPAYRATLIENFAEAVGRSVNGWVADTLAFTRPWGFDIAWITVPTLLWQGITDAFCPPAHARWLADRMPGAVLLLAEESAHLDAAEAQLEAIRWLLDG
jgi:pimeloyl-ACP methyl ester carboxylesterase